MDGRTTTTKPRATVLVTHNGRYGDLFWALPTIRALSRRIQQPIDLIIPGEFGSIRDLLLQQDYLGQVLYDGAWEQGQREFPWKAGLDQRYAWVIDLGYRGWPEPNVVRHTLDTLNEALITQGMRTHEEKAPHRPLPGIHLHDSLLGFTYDDLDLAIPWITQDRLPPFKSAQHPKVALGFSDVHFELKYGLAQLLLRSDLPGTLARIGQSPRWDVAYATSGADWTTAVWSLQGSTVFLGCCSALHVLAVATGTPVVLMEPMEARWNPVFYPLGDRGPQVLLVRGVDDRPTFDSRHVIDALRPFLQET